MFISSHKVGLSQNSRNNANWNQAAASAYLPSGESRNLEYCIVVIVTAKMKAVGGEENQRKFNYARHGYRSSQNASYLTE